MQILLPNVYCKIRIDNILTVCSVSCKAIQFEVCTLNCSCMLMRQELVVNFPDFDVIVDRQFNEVISSDSVDNHVCK